MTQPLDPSPIVTLRLHAAAQVQREGHAVAPLERKLAALLAWLHFEGATPRSRLAGLLWPDADAERGRANLRQRLVKLRALEPLLLIDDGRQMALQPLVVVDARATELLTSYDYADCESLAQWLDQRRHAAQVGRKARLAQDCRAAIEAGDLGVAQRQAEGLLVVDPESEDAHRLLMEVHYLRGAYAEAITIWDRCRDTLRQIYGVPPSPPTQALGELVLQAARSGRGVPGRARDAMPLSLLRPPQMIGRSRSLDALLAAWSAGQVICVSGSAGLGKSRLLAEFEATVGGGVNVAARPGDALQPHAALGRLVLAALDRAEPPLEPVLLRAAARMLPELAAQIGGEAAAPARTAYERRQALVAVGSVLQQCCARGCHVLVFDDLQFADLASVEALSALLASEAPGLRVAFGLRSGEESAQGIALLQSLNERSRLLRVELEPLGLPEVNALLSSLALPGIVAADLAAPLRRRVGGNPAFLLESLKLLLSLGDDALVRPELLPLAPGIDAVIMRRVDLLSTPARRLAQLVAVAGPMFSPALAVQVLGGGLAELAGPTRELEQRQVLYGRRFVHDLVASAVLHGMSPAEAERLHRGVAMALESQGADAIQVAGHWRACGEWLLAGRGFIAAAQAAGRAERPVERCQWLDAAIENLERADARDELFDAIVMRLDVSEAPDRVPRRVPLLDRLEALACSPEQELRALSQRVGWHADNGRQESFEMGRLGMERAFALGLPDVAFGFLNGVAWQMAMAGNVEAAVLSMERHRPWVLTRPTDVQADFYNMLAGVLCFSDQLLPAISTGEDSIALMRRAGRPERTLPTLNNIGLMRWWRGEFDAAKAVLLEEQVLRDRMHGSGSSLIIDMYLGAVLRDLGEFQSAIDLLSFVHRQFELEARAQGSAADLTDLVLVCNQLADFWLRIGRPQQAQALLLAQDVQGVDLRFRARRAGLLLRAGRMLGQVDTDLLAQARGMAGDIGSPFNRAWLELELARALGPRESCDEFRRLAAIEPSRQRPGMQLHALLRAAQAAHDADEPTVWQALLSPIEVLSDRCQPWDIDRASTPPLTPPSHSWPGCAACPHPSHASRRCDTPATAAAPRAGWGSAHRSARACG
jgi:DNA-binding SARP family transcriptional activator